MDRRHYDPDAVREARVRAGIASQREAARRCGIRNDTICRIERGRRVRFDHLLILATLYGADVRDWLCHDGGKKTC